jgi:hypothetical protein
MPAIEEYILNMAKGIFHKATCNAEAPCTFGPYVARNFTPFWLLREASDS